MNLRYCALALAITFSLSLPVSAADISAPRPADIPASTQQLALMIHRFNADLSSVEHTHDITGSPKREAALRSLYNSWLQSIGTLDYASLQLEDQVDYALFKRELNYRLKQLDFNRKRFDQAATLLPQADSLIALAEARRELVYADAKSSAQVLNQAQKAMEKIHAQLDGGNGKSPVSPIVAFRASKYLSSLRDDLKDWFTFYNGYDPNFTYWTKLPYESLDKEMESYSKFLRDKIAGASNPETIIGDPIGRDALMADLQHEMIPYTPEELIALAEKELSWCQNEMTKAAAEMGYKDWRQALEAVKQQSPLPGEQPKLVVQLADEAIDYVTKNDLVTVPEIAKRDWRMTMLTPEYQLQAPFFLGGEDVWVAYPTDGMPQDKKLMTLRGNNRYFSRAVVHHELIPGHHLQFFYNQRYQTQRQLFSTPFWTEGWSLYWEMQLYDRGFAKTPEEKIGMLFWRSHRAARILFSLSFHMGKMTPQQSIDLLVDRVGHERENAAAEVRRSFAGDYSPLYQTAYMLGGLQFRALHKELVESGKMTDREFHDAILMGGEMPVSVVRSRLKKQAPDKDLPAEWKFYDFSK
ncbi:MAG TPA: DUF885 family protein [Arenimonas sp.]|nr:DUF885 family protein [Arenimonas sp.]HPW31695.1 DUF885 family protein [Arenimonas sp.]